MCALRGPVAWLAWLDTHLSLLSGADEKAGIRDGTGPTPSSSTSPCSRSCSTYANGYKTYIVTGGGQDFVRVYAEQVYGIPPEQVVGTAGGTKYSYGAGGKPILTKEPKLLLNDDHAGKPEGIHLMIGRRP
jgi:hypothetical protein